MAHPSERRRDRPRQRMCVSAAITWGGRRQVCLMEDRSPKGARLRVNTDLPLPKRFTLEMQPGKPTPVRAVWRIKQLVGVRIDDGTRRLDGLHQLARQIGQAPL